MSKETIISDHAKINKNNFYKTKRLLKIDDNDVDKIFISRKEPYGIKGSFKYFIPYEDHDYIGPLCIKLPQMIGYTKCFGNNKTMSIKVTVNDSLEKYTKIRRRVSNLISIEFESEVVYGDIDKYIKTKIKMYENKVNRSFQGKEVLKKNALYDCLSLITLDSVINVSEKYYLKTLLEECKYEIKKNRRHNLISDNLEIDTDSESECIAFESESESD